MKNLKLFILTIFAGLAFAVAIPVAKPVFAATNCKNSIVGLPTWYQYLNVDSNCSPQINSPTDFLLIGLAALDILMRVAAILAVIFVIIGGVKYTTSQGSPDGTKNAKDTIVNALIGLAITIVASGVISFIARAIGK